MAAFVRAGLAWRAHAGLALLLWLGLQLPAWSQHFSFRPYTQADGLTNLAASYLVQARDADLWIGTDSGVFRFDGSRFTAYDRDLGLLKEPVRGLAEDPWGRLWTSFDRGLYVGGKAGFAPVQVAGSPLKVDAGLSVVFLGEDRLLVIVRRRIVDLRRVRGPGGESWTARALFSEAQLRATPALGDVRSMFNQPDGTVWLGCGRGLCSLGTAGVRVWGPHDGVPEADWTALLTDRDGRLWARSAARGVVREPGATRFVPRDPPHGELKSGLLVPVLTLDAQGRVLTRTASGLARWDGRGWREFTAANGLPGNVITALRTDADGDLWLSVFGQGVWHWRGYGHLESWGRADGLENDSVWAILRDARGRLVFGSDRGCQWLDQPAGRLGACPYAGLPGQQALSLALDGAGGLWFGFGSGALWRAPPGRDDAESVGTVGVRGSVAHIAFDREGLGWVGGNANGLQVLDGGSTQPRPRALPGEPDRVWESVENARGERCVATTQGLFRLRGEQAELVSIEREGAAAGFASLAMQSDGSIWATAVGQGVLHAPGCGAAGAVWVGADIVAKAHAYFVRIDGRGWIWVGTDQGVAVFDGQVWQRLDANDGLIWNDTNQNAFFADADGSVWIGTAAGLTHVIDPEGLFKRRRRPLDLHIASASLGDHALTEGTRARVPWIANASFDLRFASHSHSRSSNTEFQYRLLGLSPRWFGSRLPEVHLPALEPGSYRLEAHAVDLDHAQQSPVIALAFDVVPPWWRSTAFRVALALLGAGLLVLAWRRQVARLHARRRAIEAGYREREALLHRATRDDLTGLWNRSTILEIMTREVALSQRTRAPLAIALLDVDHFKRVNDTLGHLAGDDVLRELGARVAEALRQSDWIGRYGGEELLAVLPDLSPDEALAPVERLRECVAERPFEAQGRRIDVTLSIGLAWYEHGVDSTDDVIARADAALYEAKHRGRNQLVRAAPGARTPRQPEDAAVR